MFLIHILMVLVVQCYTFSYYIERACVTLMNMNMTNGLYLLIQLRLHTTYDLSDMIRNGTPLDHDWF